MGGPWINLDVLISSVVGLVIWDMPRYFQFSRCMSMCSPLPPSSYILFQASVSPYFPPVVSFCAFSEISCSASAWTIFIAETLFESSDYWKVMISFSWLFCTRKPCLHSGLILCTESWRACECSYLSWGGKQKLWSAAQTTKWGIFKWAKFVQYWWCISLYSSDTKW